MLICMLVVAQIGVAHKINRFFKFPLALAQTFFQP